jgi:hypothetical protein
MHLPPSSAGDQRPEPLGVIEEAVLRVRGVQVNISRICASTVAETVKLTQRCHNPCVSSDISDKVVGAGRKEDTPPAVGWRILVLG